ncbi:D-serine ammonia-lyase [Desulfovibrio sp. OttesenSCG-928-C06]|nr:D-serine ammonia-lyase [Desulfovibrio sp. OttesenSCG-928-C06]
MQPLFAEIIDKNSTVAAMSTGRPVLWTNGQLQGASTALPACGFTARESEEAEERLRRFAPFIASVFPETAPSGGIIESELREIPAMRDFVRAKWQQDLRGELWVKLDSHLPVSGSIKARGGFYEIMALAERIALEHGLLGSINDDYAALASDKAKGVFAGYSVAVGSTGNLGLSVGLMAAAFGFKATVHMSADARQWKKDLLRSRGVQVIEYDGNYSEAVRAGRLTADNDPRCHFVDDEDSRELFLGYSVAGLRLKRQLEERGVHIGPKRPLVVYLPCGVGGGPGGVSFGLKLAFGDNAHCYFAEPVQAPAVSLGLASGLDDRICGEDIGLSGRTAADGLAVTRPSALVCAAMRHLLSGAFTVPDEFLFTALRGLADTEELRLEPSALAGFYGLRHAASGAMGEAASCKEAVHLIWATGGSLVPYAEWQVYYDACGV